MTTNETPLLEVEHLEMHFPVRGGPLGRRRGTVHAVDDVTFAVHDGETLGLVGESGCGKTTLARCIARLLTPTGGHIRLRGEDITKLRPRAMRRHRHEIQMVFQDPQASLNPRKRVAQIVGVALRSVDGEERDRRIHDLLRHVGLTPDHANRFPHEFSGGQRQRIGVARALAAEPRLVVLDEPVSALDVSVQAQIVNLLGDLQRTLGLSYIFVAHDLSVVRHVSHRIAVMYLGKIVELSSADDLYAHPAHPYTAGLLAAVPVPDPKSNRARSRETTKGELPSPVDPPPGCRFHTRCPRVTEVCRVVEPPLTVYANGHQAACHHPLNVSPEDVALAVRSPSSPLASGAETASVDA